MDASLNAALIPVDLIGLKQYAKFDTEADYLALGKNNLEQLAVYWELHSANPEMAAELQNLKAALSKSNNPWDHLALFQQHKALLATLTAARSPENDRSALLRKLATRAEWKPYFPALRPKNWCLDGQAILKLENYQISVVTALWLEEEDCLSAFSRGGTLVIADLSDPTLLLVDELAYLATEESFCELWLSSLPEPSDELRQIIKYSAQPYAAPNPNPAGLDKVALSP